MNPGRIMAIVIALLILVALAPKSCGQWFFPHRHAFGTPAASTLPLDIITTPPWSAWSVTRKLSSTYTGYAYQAVRMSDTNLLDVGFTSDGLVDTNALLSWGGTGTNAAYLYILYDQSGNNRYLGFPELGSTFDPAKAPVLASNSVMIVDERNRPVAKMPGNVNASYIRIANAVTPPSEPTNTYFLVAECYTNVNNRCIVSLGADIQCALNQSTVSGAHLRIDNTGTSLEGPSYTVNTQFLATCYFQGANSAVQKNLGTVTLGNPGTFNSSSPEIGDDGGTKSAATKFSEWLYWNAKPDTNSWTAIQTNMMNFYQIVP